MSFVIGILTLLLVINCLLLILLEPVAVLYDVTPEMDGVPTEPPMHPTAIAVRVCGPTKP